MKRNNSIIYQEVDNEFKVEVQPFFVPERSIPAKKIYFYAYSITITNMWFEPCQLLKRHWIIKCGSGKPEQIEGEGVVGKQPRISPGESFKYASFCPLKTPYGNMRGRYQMISHSKQFFWVKVPLFFFRPPSIDKNNAKTI